MKCYSLIFILIGCFTHTVLAQSERLREAFTKEKKYISLELLDSLYEVNCYTLNTLDLYGVDETIEVYNVKTVGLLLLSVMPDFMSESNWTEVNFEDISAGMLTEWELERISHSPLFRKSDYYGSESKTMAFQLVKEESESYSVSNVCLAEMFAPTHYSSNVHPAIFNVRQGFLNIYQTPITVSEMMEVYGKSPGLLNGGVFPLDFRNGTTVMPNRIYLEREYLSRTLEINGEAAYQFWTLTDWSSPWSYGYNRGVDRFIYIPEKGIVGGSYDFYFLVKFDTGWDAVFKSKRDLRPRHNKTTDELWQNVIEEKVMLAEELK